MDLLESRPTTIAGRCANFKYRSTGAIYIYIASLRLPSWPFQSMPSNTYRTRTENTYTRIYMPHTAVWRAQPLDAHKYLILFGEQHLSRNACNLIKIKIGQKQKLREATHTPNWPTIYNKWCGPSMPLVSLWRHEWRWFALPEAHKTLLSKNWYSYGTPRPATVSFECVNVRFSWKSTTCLLTMPIRRVSVC